ncbi:hypothetical protein MPL1032_20774 [Mesorhizobium plurifarium]|uniref:Uncharacterized protein n=1 Tax=Mesorhizobium plurifarium TaxID=69974 RepID=A0A0K2VYL0_MESPL|nr:hypothetical protein MPL1032_20774 [Mesorhizobium plurifarium]
MDSYLLKPARLQREFKHLHGANRRARMIPRPVVIGDRYRDEPAAGRAPEIRPWLSV